MALPRIRRSSSPATLHDWMHQMFDRRGLLMDEFPDEAFFDERWSPAVDVREEAQAYLVDADIPGVDPKDIEVTLENGVLTIRGERREEHKEERENYHRVERFSGSFSRRFTLPDAADSDGVEAGMDNGVLKIRIPKKEQAVSRRIEIRS